MLRSNIISPKKEGIARRKALSHADDALTKVGEMRLMVGIIDLSD